MVVQDGDLTRLHAPAPRRRSEHPATSAVLLLAAVIVPLLAGCAPPPAAAGTPAPTATPTTGEPSAVPTEAPTATPPPTPAPPCFTFAATNGVAFPCAQATRATRKPLAVMVDDHPDARPQAGLSLADIVYQAPAEGGVPRYMLIFQTNDFTKVGPVRSARLYFVSWASEWRAAYAHVGGAPDALRKLRQIDRKLVWNEDQYYWGSYFWRTRDRFPPHNVYTSSSRLRALAKRMRGTDPLTTTPWTFVADDATVAKPAGRLVIPYKYNLVSYRYNATTNRYLRGVSGKAVQRDALNGKLIAPANVVVLFVQQRLLPNLPGESTNVEKGRLDLRIIGTGKALVMRNGELVSARWSKSSFSTQTQLTYASGCHAGEPVPLVQGQIFIQVVATSTKVTASGAAPGC
jgi:DUF3048 family protein